ncbi:MAG: hypothetical protein ABI707_13170 [Ferruginibacter sp.]
MQDEEMDNMDELIREASNSHHPAYDDKAWEKMEALLDKHLPLKNNRRRRHAIFFLLLLFIAGAAFFATLFLYQTEHEKDTVSVESKPTDILSRGSTSNGRPADGHLITKASKISKDISPGFLQGISKKETRENLKKSSRDYHPGINQGGIRASSSGAISDITNEKDIIIKTDQSLPEKDEPDLNINKNRIPASSTPGANDQPLNTTIPTVKNDSTGMVVKKETTAAATPIPSGKPTSKKAIKKGFANNFAVNLSAGPELSFVRLGDPGKGRINYGIGLSYSFANRITVRSGFYIAKKIYTAKPGDYHPPAWYWTYNTDLKKVDADCNVYEIPLAASYNFKQRKNHNWFAGIGFSTFLMKKETYNYLYKDAWGQTMNKSWTLLNGEHHYLSVLTISGGYQYRVNDHFSISAEPYLKLPLHGIGFGKINLNSGGLLFTASIRPFAKRK